MSRTNLTALLVSLLFLYLFVFDPAPLGWLSGRQTAGEAFWQPRMDGPEVLRLMLEARPLPLLGAVASLLLALLLRGWRWRVIAGALGPVPFGLVFHLSNIGYLANNLLPMRLGEVLRAGLLASRARLPLSGAMATVVLERLFDLIGILACLLGMLLLPPAAGRMAVEGARDSLGAFHALALPLSLGVGLLLVGLLALVAWREGLVRRMQGLIRSLTGREGRRPARWLGHFASGLEILRSPRMGLLLLLQTGLLLGCYLLSLRLMLAAYGLEGAALPLLAAHPFGSLLLLLVFVSLGYMIPAAPGALGTVQYFSALGLGLLGAATSPAQSFALANHLLTWLVLTLAGALALPALGLRWADLKLRSKEEPTP
jgi:glycosyltransferase 2 family protein